MGNARGDWNTMDVRAVLAVWGMVIGLAVTPSLAGSMWETDFEKAAASAKASHRYMLLDFSGSDWCGWCIKLEDEWFCRVIQVERHAWMFFSLFFVILIK